MTSKNISPFLLGFSGACVGALVLFADLPWWNASARRFASRPEFLVWGFFVCAQAAAWALGSVSVSRSLRDLWEARRGHRVEIVGGAIAFTVLVVVLLLISSLQGNTYPLPHHQAKAIVLTSIAYCVALGSAVGMWLIYAELDGLLPGATNARLPGRSADDRAHDDMSAVQIDRFLRLREHLRRLLAVQGVILGGGILATGALRNAILANHPSARFPQESVLVYGAFLSGLMFLVYVPTYARLLNVGRCWRDSVFPVLAPTSTGWRERYEQRTTFEELLGLHIDTASSLRAGVVILTPLAAAITGTLLGAS